VFAETILAQYVEGVKRRSSSVLIPERRGANGETDHERGLARRFSLYAGHVLILGGVSPLR
jgi:hypothetical protein